MAADRKQRPVPAPPFVELVAKETLRVCMVPAVPGLVAFANEVRRAVAALQPDHITLELPRELGPRIVELLGFLPRVRLLAWRLPDGRALAFAADVCDAVIEGARLALEEKIPFHCIDTLTAGSDEELPILPDSEAVEQLGVAAYHALCMASLAPAPSSSRTEKLAQRIASLRGTILHIGFLTHVEPLRALLETAADRPPVPDDAPSETPESRFVDLEERRLSAVLRELPALVQLYERFRQRCGDSAETFKKGHGLTRLLARASRRYRREFDEQVNLTEWRALTQFARNLSVVQGRLMPGLEVVMTAAQGCVDDDFAAIVLETVTAYAGNRKRPKPDWDPESWQPEVPLGEDAQMNGGEDEATSEGTDGESRRLRHESLSLHCAFNHETVRLMWAYPRPEAAELIFHFKRRRPHPTMEMKDGWKQDFEDMKFGGISHICSWPPESAFEEKFFRGIRNRAFQQVSAAHSTTEEFSTSVMDGMDVRETMRRWHEGKIFVRRERIPPGRVGPVVILWRDFPLWYDDLWSSTLYAEDETESDVAVYSSPLGEHLVGPGIHRIEYHGILSVFPAQGIPDVWQLAPLARFKTYGRFLTAAALLLSRERYVALLAPNPPDAEMKAFARSLKKSILYLPLGTFNKDSHKRARHVHFLVGKNVRSWAGDYIPEH